MTTYVTAGGEMIDEIAWRHYGHQIGTAEAIMHANPDLAGHAPLLPPGLSITLPEIKFQTLGAQPVKLYD